MANNTVANNNHINLQDERRVHSDGYLVVPVCHPRSIDIDTIVIGQPASGPPSTTVRDQQTTSFPSTSHQTTASNDVTANSNREQSATYDQRITTEADIEETTPRQNLSRPAHPPLSTPRGLHRQVTFGTTPGVITADASSNTDPNGHVGDTNGAARGGTPSSEDTVFGCFERCPPYVDSATVCYLMTGCFLLVFGLGISFIIANEANGDTRVAKGQRTAQLWVVGPIFICSGILILVKACIHVHKRLHPEAHVHRGAAIDGHMLSPDSRASLQRYQTLPPAYSKALNAPLPSNVMIEDDKLPDDLASNRSDAESLARTTIDFEPRPPDYDEAIEIMRRREEEERRDISMEQTQNLRRNNAEAEM